MNKIGFSTIISFYGAIVATISMVWNIFSFFLKSRKKLFIKYSIKMNMPDNETQKYYRTLSIEIINKCQVDILISSISLSLCGKNIENDGFRFNELTKVDIRGIKKFPITLKKGEVFSDTMNIDDIIYKINSSLDDKNKLCIIVKDTLGKKYKSRKFKYKILKYDE